MINWKKKNEKKATSFAKQQTIKPLVTVKISNRTRSYDHAPKNLNLAAPSASYDMAEKKDLSKTDFFFFNYTYILKRDIEVSLYQNWLNYLMSILSNI